MQMLGSDEEVTQIPTQAQSVVEGSGAVLVSEYKPVPDVDYLQMLGSDEEVTQIPTQAQSVVEGSGAVLVSEYKPVPDVDYLQVCCLAGPLFASPMAG
ncbi:unnamed protein product [Ilex paraguariensis]|uniref:Uncharacterized protein n=1 Tax=Ilex paraguariensis TaxID=185542 RepID=A0ABC8QU74_9AQUA